MNLFGSMLPRGAMAAWGCSALACVNEPSELQEADDVGYVDDGTSTPPAGTSTSVGTGGTSGSSTPPVGSSGPVTTGPPTSGGTDEATESGVDTDDGTPTSEGDPSEGDDEGPPDCETPPPASELVGWAAVAGRGLNTTTGGGDADPIVVTTLEDLRDAAAGTNPAVIHVRGTLPPGDLDVGSNKTIVGLCGAEIHGHVEIREASNVIVRNITIVGYGEGDCALDPDFDAGEGCSSGADAVSVQRDSHHIWFDHCEIRDGTDGNLDITNGADLVTISWTIFRYTPRIDAVGDDSTGAAGHRYSNLVGGTDSPGTFDDANALNVTWHHDWWSDNVVERQPRVRFGQNHLFNNLHSSDTTNYCVRAGRGARILLEGNTFDGVRDPHEFNNATDEDTAFITADATNAYLGTSGTEDVGGGGTPFVSPPYDYDLEPADDASTRIRASAGPR